MEEGFNVKITFSDSLSEEEQSCFWDKFISYIEKYGFYFGGGHNAKRLEGYIDTTFSGLTKEKAIKKVEEAFRNMEYISNISFMVESE